MNILFIHQNFPGQYKHLAPLLASKGHQCVSLTLRVKEPTTWKGVKVLPYALPDRGVQNVHPWLLDLDSKVTRGQACFLAARKLRDNGFVPDLILAHPGWARRCSCMTSGPTPVSGFTASYITGRVIRI